MTTPTRTHRALPSLVIGATSGLAWASGLRGFMAMIAGPESTVAWSGTFLWILLPGLVTGLLLGWAEYLRRTGGRRRWRWLALAPMTFMSVLLTTVTDPASFLEGGIGGGAIGVPLAGMAGGYALSRRGPAWARALAALLPLSTIPIWAVTAQSVGGSSFALDHPQGAWIALFFWTFLATLSFACAIPHLPVTDTEVDTAAGVASASRGSGR
jgi:hypothetical protein